MQTKVTNRVARAQEALERSKKSLAEYEADRENLVKKYGEQGAKNIIDNLTLFLYIREDDLKVARAREAKARVKILAKQITKKLAEVKALREEGQKLLYPRFEEEKDCPIDYSDRRELHDKLDPNYRVFFEKGE